MSNNELLLHNSIPLHVYQYFYIFRLTQYLCIVGIVSLQETCY